MCDIQMNQVCKVVFTPAQFSPVKPNLERLRPLVRLGWFKDLGLVGSNPRAQVRTKQMDSVPLERGVH